MAVQVIVLNGTSSSGKTTLGRELQETLAETWFLVGSDTLIDIAPPRVERAMIGSEGSVDGDWPEFREAERLWMAAMAAWVRAGAHLIVDEVFLSGQVSAARWREALSGVPIFWVGVHCDLAEAERRERSRPDRVVGMAARQAPLVHRGMQYDLEVDTTHAAPADLARVIADRLAP